jgi:hypothetical protein
LRPEILDRSDDYKDFQLRALLEGTRLHWVALPLRSWLARRL